MMKFMDRSAGGCQTFVPALLIFPPDELLLKKSGENPHPLENIALRDSSHHFRMVNLQVIEYQENLAATIPD